MDEAGGRVVMDVDEPGREHAAFPVDNRLAVARLEVADIGDPPLLDADTGDPERPAGPVRDLRIDDHERLGRGGLKGGDRNQGRDHKEGDNFHLHGATDLMGQRSA